MSVSGRHMKGKLQYFTGAGNPFASFMTIKTKSGQRINVVNWLAQYADKEITIHIEVND